MRSFMAVMVLLAMSGLCSAGNCATPSVTLKLTVYSAPPVVAPQPPPVQLPPLQLQQLPPATTYSDTGSCGGSVSGGFGYALPATNFGYANSGFRTVNYGYGNGFNNGGFRTVNYGAGFDGGFRTVTRVRVGTGGGGGFFGVQLGHVAFGFSRR